MPDGQLPRLPSKGGRRQQERNSATFAALIGLLMLAFGFVALVSLVLPQVRGLVLILVCGVGFFAVHYLTWGRWLIRLREKEAAKAKATDE
ncbi:MAG: hypothetical protein KDA93_15895 [Planctomycetaceae bacterium]|nr:hypothetical protein [Planctomycetaceae bacterium]